MSITVVKEHGQVRILRIDGEVPPDRPVQLFTQDEILARPGLSPMERLQLESILRDEEDWEELLDPHILSEQG